jgi:hypothetical protein
MTFISFFIFRLDTEYEATHMLKDLSEVELCSEYNVAAFIFFIDNVQVATLLWFYF